MHIPSRSRMYKGEALYLHNPAASFQRDAPRKRDAISYTWCLFTCVYGRLLVGGERKKERSSKFNDYHPTSALFRGFISRVFLLQKGYFLRGSPNGFVWWSKPRKQTVSTCERAANLERKKRSFYESLPVCFISLDAMNYIPPFAAYKKHEASYTKIFRGYK